ncbi:MAG: Fic family protein [Propionicimonas sp.]
MLYTSSGLDERELAVLSDIENLRQRLRNSLHEPRRWSGSLRRLAFARNIQGSNSIEGYDARLDDVAAVALGEMPLDSSEETRLALEGYRNAMTYVLQRADDNDVECSVSLIKSLHFMMTGYSLLNRPGRWRAGPIYVLNEQTQAILHEGAPVDEVPGLMADLASSINDSGDEELLVKAAMAHLNLVMIHPFRDGNGRMARCLQSLVLARNGILSPVFMSIEEYLGRNTQAYYDVLANVGGGHWAPSANTRPWIRFTLTAHLRQAGTLRRRIDDAERLWLGLERLVGAREERQLAALHDAAMGMRLRRATYLKIAAESGSEISEQTAGRDLKTLADLGYLEPHGERRGRYYVATPVVRDVWLAIRGSRPIRDDTDPFSD